jgi:hypothetical protein
MNEMSRGNSRAQDSNRHPRREERGCLRKMTNNVEGIESYPPRSTLHSWQGQISRRKRQE